jgi:hypothetical protein
MKTLQKFNQTIGYTIGKKVSPQAGLKHKVSRLFKHLSMLLKDTQPLGGSYGPPESRNDKSYPV